MGDDALLGAMMGEYLCPFPDCGHSMTCHPHEFDARLQVHLDVEHDGIKVAQLRDEVARSQGPAR